MVVRRGMVGGEVSMVGGEVSMGGGEVVEEVRSVSVRWSSVKCQVKCSREVSSPKKKESGNHRRETRQPLQLTFLFLPLRIDGPYMDEIPTTQSPLASFSLSHLRSLAPLSFQPSSRNTGASEPDEISMWSDDNVVG